MQITIRVSPENTMITPDDSDPQFTLCFWRKQWQQYTLVGMKQLLNIFDCAGYKHWFTNWLMINDQLHWWQKGDKSKSFFHFIFYIANKDSVRNIDKKFTTVVSLLKSRHFCTKTVYTRDGLSWGDQVSPCIWNLALIRMGRGLSYKRGTTVQYLTFYFIINRNCFTLIIVLALDSVSKETNENCCDKSTFCWVIRKPITG